MTKLETPVIVALLVAFAVFLASHALPVFVLMVALALLVVALALARVART